MTAFGELESADVLCAALARRHYENFTVSSLLVPRRLRHHMARVYAFCRTTDDLGDESGADAMRRLERWRADVDDLFDGRRPVHPVLVALADTVREFSLPRAPFLDLVAANAQDQVVSEYATWSGLRGYCMLSAAPVGRVVLRLFDIPGDRAVILSDDVCIGLQLANFAQDVAVDRAKGRTYLLQDDLRAHGLAGAVSAMCDRAAGLLASGRELEAMAPSRLRLQLSLYRLGGEAIVAAVRRQGCRTDLSRPHVPRAVKTALAARALRDAATRGAPAAPQARGGTAR